jgi:plastocyanin
MTVSVATAGAHVMSRLIHLAYLARLPRLALIAVAAVALAACGSGSAGGSPAGGPGGASGCQPTNQAGGVAVAIASFAFNPGTIQAKVGQPVTWTNNDTASHGAVLDSDASCTTGSFGKGGSGSLVFDKAGTFTYHCPVHGSSMKGTITITN